MPAMSSGAENPSPSLAMWSESGFANSIGAVDHRLKCRWYTWNFRTSISRSPMSVDLDALLSLSYRWQGRIVIPEPPLFGILCRTR